ncbi:LOW QUALITY PROTEIN: dihydroxyacetone kinase, DhaK subunit [Ruminiclostridium papyrosolvens DSM 2782]|uniref:phosphoenolpyruvate--glycerone phosphotransferase n=1 Tax=Ruminiclostridium papyrosolvens DSM 2782 TaxID=588581 RepID=F1T822_9FIRM|nr:LOW QUALITY PROTEIN: dihydroxyacetone kinase, DhaK subunit [Ruminiclostridium papyrosolvens DSM 2782]
MKKIINKVEDIVIEMCEGIVKAHPEQLAFSKKYKIIKRKHLNKDKVTLISGGGSGHEPAHAGFVGKGMLDVAVCGDVFASPSTIQVYNAILETESDKGTLLIIKNYSGDCMNFDAAAEMAEDDDIVVDKVYVNDDVAVKDSLYTVGRRGVAGTVFVHKLAGAAAEQGMDLKQVKEVAQKVINNVRSIGFALTSCTVPAKGTPTFCLNDDEIEFGVGIHGEPGIAREKIATAEELAVRMVDLVTKDLPIVSGDEVALLVNGLGGTPLQELYLLNNSVAAALENKNIKIYKTFVGNYMTAIDMAGASISLLKLDDELKSYLDASADTPALKSKKREEVQDMLTTKKITELVMNMADVIIANEVYFCELDSVAGDGDFGMSVAKGFKQLKQEWNDVSQENIGAFLKGCGMIITEYCGGASGPIWGSAFRSAAKYAGDKTELDLPGLAALMQSAVEGIQKRGGAKLGDKTLLDALIPATESLKASAEKGEEMLSAMKAAAEAAVAGGEKTKTMVATKGRASYVGERSVNYPDAGAVAIGVIFTELTKDLNLA